MRFVARALQPARYSALRLTIEYLSDNGTEPVPRRNLLVELRPSAFGELVVLRAAVVVRSAPRRFDPALPFETMQGGVERTLTDVQRGARDLMEALRDRPPMLRGEGNCLEDQQVERALR